MWRNLLSSLRFRILAGNLALILLMFGLITANTLRVVNELAVETIQTTARQTSETLNLAIAPYTTSENLGTLQDYFQELVSGGA
ncbi:MAG: hypothetical protein HZB57_02155, partial [Gammaproteobacteria bacterium]|nr:hypothetical protein [Gammaproteobacteria bacterium]